MKRKNLHHSCGSHSSVSVNSAYIYENDVSEAMVGLSMALAGFTGIIGTFLFTRLHRLRGLNCTGLVAFAAESAASFWLSLRSGPRAAHFSQTTSFLNPPLKMRRFVVWAEQPVGL